MKRISLVCAFGAVFLGAFGQSATKTISIQPKQTLYAIARDYNVPAAELKKLNPQYAPDFQMKIGDKFVVPVSTSETPKPTVEAVTVKPAETKTAAATTTGTHIVAQGESLYAIARQYGMQPRELFAMNDLTAQSTVKIGQKLKVSKPATTVAETAPPAANITEIKTTTNTEVVFKPLETSAKTTLAKENVPSDNITAKPVVSAPATPTKRETAAAVKNIAPTAATPTVVSSKFQSDFNNSVNPNTKRTLRGIAKITSNPELTSSSFVLYNYAEEGDIVKVVNLMTKKVIYLKVVGKTENPGEEVVLQVSFDTAKMLQANENRFLVEVTGY